MGLSRFFHRPRHTPLLLLVLVLLLPLVFNPVYAGTPILFKNFCHNNINLGTTINCTLAGVSTADTIIVNIFGVGVFNGFSVSDGQGNVYAEKVFSISGSGSGAGTFIYTTLSAASGGSLVVTVATGGASRTYGFSASDYSGITGFGATGTDQQDGAGNSGTSTVSLTGTLGTSAMIDDIYITGTAATFTANNGQTIRDSGTSSGPCNLATCVASDSTSPILGWSWSGGLGCSSCSVSHSSMEVFGSSSAPLTTVFQCYGNCGSPAITLVNTNSTHTVNFNQSITLFYEFQSNLNGFLLNVTTNVAKNYQSGSNGPLLGVYTIPACQLGTTPFTPVCPGQLQNSAGFFGPPKGRASLANLRVPVFNGQWVAIAISASIAGLDVNDTNTGVNLFQTNEGKIPTTIQQASVFGNSKAGLWAWITGNVMVGSSPPTATQFNCAGFLDCILPNWVSSLCALGSPTCLGMSGFVWAGILGVVFTFVVVKYGTELAPSVRVPFGEVFMLFFLMWLFVMSGLGLTFIWIPIFFFFVISILMRKNVGSFL